MVFIVVLFVGDTRESAAIYIAKHLMDEGANLSIYDPKVSLNSEPGPNAIYHSITFASLFLKYYSR